MDSFSPIDNGITAELTPLAVSAATRAPRQTSEITDTAVILDGTAYQLAEIPAATHGKLALIGLRYLLVQSDNVVATMEKLRDGLVPGRKVAAPKAAPTDHWREAGAMVQAEIWAKAQSIRANPGKKLHDHPDFIALLPAAREVTAAWDRKAISIAQKTKRVVEVWTDLAQPDTAGIFAAPVEQKNAA